MAEINLGKVKLTETEMQELVREYNGGLRFGTDENGNDGYFKYDEEAGADTFHPFKKGGGGGDGAISSPLIHAINFSGCYCSTYTNNLISYFPIQNVTRLVLKKLRLEIRRLASSAANKAILFYVYGYKKDGTTYLQTIYSNSVSTSAAASSTAMAERIVEDEEIDLSEYEKIEKICVQIPGASATSYTYYYTVEAELELYF